MPGHYNRPAERAVVCLAHNQLGSSIPRWYHKHEQYRKLTRKNVLCVVFVVSADAATQDVGPRIRYGAGYAPIS